MHSASRGARSVPSSLILHERLRDCDSYLSQYPCNHRSTHFEELVCQAFAGLLHLPFYDADNEDTCEEYRVTWNGSASSSSKAPPGPDGIAWAHGFSVVIEATQKTGTTQWSQEFARCLDHARTVAEETDMDETDIYTVLVITETHRDTCDSVKAYNESNDLKIVLMELGHLCTAIETSFLAFTIRHTEALRLLQNLLDCLSSADDLQDFRDRGTRCVLSWQKYVLELERTVVLAVRSYLAMMKVARAHVGVGEILAHLLKDPLISKYFEKVERELRLEVIANSLTQESLGVRVGRVRGEQLFCPIPLVEFESRCQRRLQAVREAYARA